LRKYCKLLPSYKQFFFIAFLQFFNNLIPFNISSTAANVAERLGGGFGCEVAAERGREERESRGRRQRDSHSTERGE
jgi:hypothetical protein